MKQYTTKNENTLIQITTKLTPKNHSYIINLREWFGDKGVVLSQQEIINNILEHSLKSTEAAIQIDKDLFSYSELIKELEQRKIATINLLALYGVDWLERKSGSKMNSDEFSKALSTNYDDLRKALSNQYNELSTHQKGTFKAIDDLDMANTVMAEMSLKHKN